MNVPIVKKKIDGSIYEFIIDGVQPFLNINIHYTFLIIFNSLKKIPFSENLNAGTFDSIFRGTFRIYILMNNRF